MAALTRALVIRAPDLRVPGDKSISHRALMLAALADGPSRITGLLNSADVRNTAQCLERLGAHLAWESEGVVSVSSGRIRHREPAVALDCGNSGTTARLLAGVVAGAGRTATFTGDASLSRRPMRRIADPLVAMGAVVTTGAHGGLPMQVTGGALRDIEWHAPVASAQVKSAVLLAACAAGVRAAYDEPALSRDHTERMLLARGATLIREGTRVSLEGGTLRALDQRVPGDPSSAAFLVALAVLADEGELRIPDVCLNGTRTGFYDVLQRMGAAVTFDELRTEGGEEWGTIIAHPAALHAVTVEPGEIPSLVDEIPLLACLAAYAEGETVITGASELRVKESDRIGAVVHALRALGADANELPDGLRIRGQRQPLRGRIRTHGDHRIAMAFGVLSALPGNDIVMDDRECVAVSYPDFWRDLERVRS